MIPHGTGRRPHSLRDRHAMPVEMIIGNSPYLEFTRRMP